MIILVVTVGVTHHGYPFNSVNPGSGIIISLMLYYLGGPVIGTGLSLPFSLPKY